MKERPILFSAPMVRAILDDTKTQTRRICKPAQFFSLSNVVEVPDPQERGQVYNGSHFGDEDGEVQFACPYGGRGDRLWVRETWAAPHGEDARPPRAIQCDQMRIHYAASEDRGGLLWRPSIHMPRWASRITLEITGVRVEQLQDISEADARSEGAPPSHPSIDRISREFGYADFPRSWYGQLWESINGPGSWDLNPWVWVVEFKRVSP